jgi:hypothetical protein
MFRKGDWARGEALTQDALKDWLARRVREIPEDDRVPFGQPVGAVEPELIRKPCHHNHDRRQQQQNRMRARARSKAPTRALVAEEPFQHLQTGLAARPRQGPAA